MTYEDIDHRLQIVHSIIFESYRSHIQNLRNCIRRVFGISRPLPFPKKKRNVEFPDFDISKNVILEMSWDFFLNHLECLGVSKINNIGLGSHGHVR